MKHALSDLVGGLIRICAFILACGIAYILGYRRRAQKIYAQWPETRTEKRRPQ